MTQNRRNQTILGIGVATALLIVGGWLSTFIVDAIVPEVGSAEAVRIDALWRFLFFFGGAIILLVQGVLVWVIIFYRRRPNDDTDGPNVHGNFTLEVVWTVLPTILVTVVAIYSYQVWVLNQSPKDNELVVNVTSQRFAFGFSYFDEATQAVVTSNELHTYVGRPVKLSMTAVDVIHSFWLPTMRVKQDMLPGRTTELRFTPTLAGTYPVVCTELCGGGHGGMNARVIVHEDEQAYLAWFAPQLDRVLNPPEDPVERGRQLLASGRYPCNGCHVLDELGWPGIVGPNLNVYGTRAANRVPGQSAYEYTYSSIRYPSEYIVPGYQNQMPAFGEDQMSEEEIDAIIQYLLTLGVEAPAEAVALAQ